jgi:xylulokinase
MAEYIGIDVGTTNIKSALYTFSGEVLRQTSRPTPKTKIESCSLYEYNMECVFKCVLDCLCELNKNKTHSSPRAMAVSSMGESGILLDKELKSLTNAIPWFNPKTAPQAQRLTASLGSKKIFHITGQFPSGKFGIAKLMWYKDNQPEVFEKAKYWMSVNDYILYRLSGRRVCEYSIAARTMAFDIRKLQWSLEICGIAGIDPDMFGEPIPGGVKIGSITAEIAEKTGLSTDTSVVTGGHDHLCALIGAGTIEDNSMLSSMGTSEVTVCTLKEPMTSDIMFDHQYCVSPHCSNRLYRLFGSIQACGASIEWFLNNLGGSLIRQADTPGKNKFARMEEAALACQNNDSLLFFPLIRGSLFNADAGGLFTGIKDHHTLAHFAKALMDGLCCEFTWQTENCMKILGTVIHTVNVVGGPARSDYLMQRKADISGLRVEVQNNQEAACYGASLLAAVGVQDTSFEKINQKKSITKSFVPSGENTNRDIYRRYRSMRETVDELNLLNK